MFRSFNEVEQSLVGSDKKKKIALCGAHDDTALGAVVQAKRKGVVTGILIGNEKKILALLHEMGEEASDYEIINEQSERGSSEMALSFVKEGRADIEMKGKMPSTEYLMPIMHPFDGLLPLGKMLSEATVFYYPDGNRLILATDCAITIAPSLDEKVKLIENALNLARAFGFEQINVAAVSALAEINPQIISTVEARELTQMDWGSGVNVFGPLALDNALDVKSARDKGIENDVAGCADILLMPDICTGNVLHKCLHFFGHLPSASVMCGTTKPVVFTSRSDSAETKYYSILSAILQSQAT